MSPARTLSVTKLFFSPEENCKQSTLQTKCSKADFHGIINDRTSICTRTERRSFALRVFVGRSQEVHFTLHEAKKANQLKPNSTTSGLCERINYETELTTVRSVKQKLQ